MDKAVELFNNCFWPFIMLLIIWLVCTAISLYSRLKTDEFDMWYNFAYTLKKQSMEMIVVCILVWLLNLILNESFSINLMKLLHFLVYWKVIVGIWILFNVISGIKLYARLNFSAYLRTVKQGEHGGFPETIMLNIIDDYNTYYAIQVERLRILKSLTPVSLIPLIAGYILEEKNIKVDWNWSTAAFAIILFIYFYNLWNCYSKIKLWKIRVSKVQKELRDYRSKHPAPQSNAEQAAEDI